MRPELSALLDKRQLDSRGNGVSKVILFLGKVVGMPGFDAIRDEPKARRDAAESASRPSNETDGRVRLVGMPGFEPGTSCTPSRRASQAALHPEN